MSLAELKRELAQASPADRIFLAAYLRHLSRVNTSSNRADLEVRMREMDAGRKVSLAQALRAHELLKADQL